VYYKQGIENQYVAKMEVKTAHCFSTDEEMRKIGWMEMHFFASLR